MEIQPGSDIKIIKGCPLDSDYKNTLFFNNKTEQYNYFNSLTKFNLSALTYQRVNKNTIRVQIQCDALYDCNYLMFRNTNYSDKWFYAFLTGVEYVNDTTANIYYTIDYMQTWLFDYQLKESFVEREHTLTDVVGDNIEPESIDGGDLVFNSYYPLTSTVEFVVLISVIEDGKGCFIGGIYSGVQLYGIRVNISNIDGAGAQQLALFLDNYSAKPEEVLSIHTIPAFLLSDDELTILSYTKVTAFSELVIRSKTRIFSAGNCEAVSGGTLDGYKPRNKKLYTYPFNFLSINNGDGNALQLRYEFFENGEAYLLLFGNISNPTSVVCQPYAYRNVPTGTDTDYPRTITAEQIAITNFPLSSWAYDSFKLWMANGALQDTLSAAVAGGVAGFKLGGAGGAAVGALAGGWLGVAKGALNSEWFSADVIRGTTGSNNAALGAEKLAFYVGRASITAQKAAIIDDFFDKFGYAINRVKVPTITGRPHWNYVKTQGCNIIGDMPQAEIKKVCERFDTGITFWKSGEEVGNYSLDNTI